MKQLVLSSVTKVTKQKTLLRDITLSLEPHHIYGLIGPNGAGKTTLFRCLLGLTSATGTITYDGKKVTAFDNADFLRQVGVVSPFPDSYDKYTVADLFERHMHYYDVSLLSIEHYLKTVGLKVSLNDTIGMFSLGMKQRLTIALALLHQPDIILLDEPFNGLDRQGMVLLQDLLIDCKEQGKLIIIASHSFSELENIADQIVTIRHGEIIAEVAMADMKEKGFETLDAYYQQIQGDE